MRLIRLKTLTISLALASIANASVLSTALRADTIRVKMNDVDDVGYVIVINKEGSKTVLQCSWGSGNHGTAVKDIGDDLAAGENFIIFALYNKVFDGGAFQRRQVVIPVQSEQEWPDPLERFGIREGQHSWPQILGRAQSQCLIVWRCRRHYQSRQHGQKKYRELNGDSGGRAGQVRGHS